MEAGSQWALMTTLIVSELILSQEGAPKSHRSTSQISHETRIRHSLVYRIVRQNLKLKFLKKRLVQNVANCAYHRTCKRKLLCRFPASTVDFIFFTDHLVWKLVVDILITWSDRILLCFEFISNWVVKHNAAKSDAKVIDYSIQTHQVQPQLT